MARNPNGTRPAEVSVSLDISDFYEYFGNPLEDEIILTYGGKEKTILTGNGETIITSPGVRGTLSNLTTGESLDVMLPGTFHISTLEDGTEVEKYTGINILGDPFIGQDGQYAVVQTRGNFTWDGEPLSGNGQINYVVDDLLL
jgi:hypothetical protein